MQKWPYLTSNEVFSQDSVSLPCTSAVCPDEVSVVTGKMQAMPVSFPADFISYVILQRNSKLAEIAM
jgi:hypothetical protein